MRCGQIPLQTEWSHQPLKINVIVTFTPKEAGLSIRLLEIQIPYIINHTFNFAVYQLILEKKKIAVSYAREPHSF